MSPVEKRYTCPICAPPKGDGWHYREDPDTLELTAEPCPNKASTRQHEDAQQLAKLANENAWQAAQQIITDVAEELPQFNANVIRERFEHAGVPTSLRGSAFKWAADQQLIRKAGSVMSDEATTRHEVGEWVSLVHRSRRAG